MASIGHTPNQPEENLNGHGRSGRCCSHGPVANHNGILAGVNWKLSDKLKTLQARKALHSAIALFNVACTIQKGFKEQKG